jgi:DNA-3-methyladenine glycosylase II
VKTFQRSAKKASSRVARAPHRVASPPQLIETEADIKRGIKALRRKCDVLRRIHDLTGDPPLRRTNPGFEGLARIIVGQQVSVASANAIWTRFSAVAQTMTPARVAALSDLEFQTGGLSRPKIKTLRAVAAAAETGLDLIGLAMVDEAEARAALIAISGIGPWTADLYLMFCLGRADVFAPGDLALQVAAERAFELAERPNAEALAQLAAERWQPWRGVAARLLWHYYAHLKSTAGQPV